MTDQNSKILPENLPYPNRWLLLQNVMQNNLLFSFETLLFLTLVFQPDHFFHLFVFDLRIFDLCIPSCIPLQQIKSARFNQKLFSDLISALNYIIDFLLVITSLFMFVRNLIIFWGQKVSVFNIISLFSLQSLSVGF